ncbi:MAG: GGDEF domain-containing protein [Pseudomonadota bacterium]
MTLLGDTLLSTNAKRRLRIARSMLAFQIYLAGDWIGQYAISHWSVDVADVRAYQIISGLFSVLVYALIRGGWSERLADPSLTVLQIVVAQTLAVWCYAIFSPVRGALMLLQIIIIFFALFTLKPRGQLLVTVYPLVLMGLSMWGLSVASPATFAPDIEWVHFVILATTLPSVAMLGGQISSMQDKLRKQKIALEGALARIQDLANRDELTGLPNRRYMLDVLHSRISLFERSGQSFCLAILDLDHFKQVNDVHGHQVGDEVLKTFAQQSAVALRETDLLARWGGEEFLLLMADSCAPHAAKAIDRIRENLSQVQMTTEAPQLRITFSAGFVQFLSGDTLDSAIERADQALYTAKKNGRNRTVIG